MDPADRRLLNVRTYRLVDVEERAELHPGRFEIPELEQRRNLGPDFMAKLVFELEPPPETGPTGERMWVAIEARLVGVDGKIMYRGRLLNDPFVCKGAITPHGLPLAYDVEIFFEPRNIANYETKPDEVRPKPRTPEEQKTYSGEFVLDPWGQAGDPKRRD